jgi:hypothetical protein
MLRFSLGCVHVHVREYVGVRVCVWFSLGCVCCVYLCACDLV